MKNTLILFLLLSVTLTYAQQDTFIIPSGSKKVVNASLNVDRFVMKDNSTLIIKGVWDWKLEALVAEIGRNCKILNKCDNGQNGGNGNTGGKGSRCKRGKRGGNGGHGSKGQRGRSVNLKAHFETLGNLTIDVRGGNGGNGGNGGRGGKGGGKKYEHGFVKCGGGSGGNGGTGGNSGAGGDGGHVDVYYEADGVIPTIVTDRQQLPSSEGIKILVAGGTSGKAGVGGNGGSGGGSKGSGSRGVGGSRLNNGKAGYYNVDTYSNDCLSELKDETEALIIYVSEYEKPEPEWKAQAHKLKSVLEQKYSFKHVNMLENPTIQELKQKLRSYTTGYSDTNLMIYLSGHGQKTDEGYYDFITKGENTLSFDDITTIINKADLNNLLFIMDACYSGKLLDSPNINTYNPTGKVLKSNMQLCGHKGKSIITAGFENELVDTTLTTVLLKVLQRNKNKTISAEQIFYKMVGEDLYTFKSQRPSFGKVKTQSKGDFIFHLK